MNRFGEYLEYTIFFVTRNMELISFDVQNASIELFKYIINKCAKYNPVISSIYKRKNHLFFLAILSG